jgi:hypothetical protein
MTGAHERDCHLARHKPAYHGRALGELGFGGCVVIVELHYVATAAAAGARQTVPSIISMALQKAREGGMRAVEGGHECTVAQRTDQHRGGYPWAFFSAERAESTRDPKSLSWRGDALVSSYAPFVVRDARISNANQATFQIRAEAKGAKTKGLFNI